MKKRFLAIALSLAMVISLLPVGAMAASSNGVERAMKDILSVYPNNSYFTVNGKSCSHSKQKGCSNCSMLKITAANGQKAASGQGDAWTCLGFASYIMNQVYGVNIAKKSPVGKMGSTTSASTYANAKIGDIVYFYSSGRNFQHAAIFMGHTDNGIILYDCNSSSTVAQMLYRELTYKELGTKYANYSKPYSRVFRASTYDKVNQNYKDGSCIPSTSPVIKDDNSEKNGPSTLRINLTSYPSSINKGDLYNLKGTVSSNYKIKEVKGYIIDSAGKTVQTSKDAPNKTSMDIYNANLNTNLSFNKLNAGTYTLKVTATDASGEKAKTWSKAFTVKGKNSESTPPASSTLKIEMTRAPRTIVEDDVYNLKGSVTSNYELTKLEGYIINSKGKTVLYASEDPKGTRSNIYASKANTGLTFETLPAGTYTLKIIATDSSKATKTFERNFTVITRAEYEQSQSTLKINVTKYPTKIKKYSPFGLYGSITSNYKITEVKGYVIDVKDNYVELSSVDKPNKTSMDINKANLNNDLTFNTLYRDTYILKIVAKDASGKTVTWSKTFQVT